MTSRRPGLGLLRMRDFRHLWLADAVSQLGTRVTFLAMPLLAVLTLRASPLEVSLLRSAETVAWLLLGLQVGVWCDRTRARPVLVAADLVRAAAFGWVPVGAALGVLAMWQLYATVLVAGVASIFFDVSRSSYLPRLVAADDLMEANAKLAGTLSTAAVAAPSVGGALVQWLTAPVAILVDAASYLWSAVSLATIHHVEERPRRPARRALRQEVRDGLRLVAGHPALRAIAAHRACRSLFQSAHIAVSVPFLVRAVHLSPALIGVLSTTGLLGALASSLVTRRLAGVLGAARLLWTSGVGFGAGFLLFPLTSAGPGLAYWAVGVFVTSAAIVTLNIVESSFRPRMCPGHLLGRLNATMQFTVWGVMPVGSLLGGLVATATGLRATLWVTAWGVLASSLWLVLSPLRGARDLPGPAGAQDPAHVTA